jgi:AcrR family transcriptional regulator
MRSRLLRSALGLAARKGPSMMSIDDVIRAAQVSRGTFYKYFPSPDALIRELAAEIANDLIRIAQPVVRACEDPVERVARGIRLVLRIAIHHPAVAEFLVRLGWPDEQEPNMLEFVRHDIEEGFRLGRFKYMHIAMALNIVAGAVLGAMRRMLEPDCAEDISEQVAAVALRALGVDSEAADRISRAPLDMDGIQFAGGFAEALINAS